MRSATLFAAAAALITSVCAQAGKYCDQQNRCFASYTNNRGIRWGFAIPEGATAPFDVIYQVTAPIAIGWAGLAWGGSMTYNPLAIAWANGENVLVASRLAYGYYVPPPYANATYTLLEGSYANQTHFVATALCEGCSSWDPLGNQPTTLNPSGQNSMAFAFSTVPVDQPGNVETTFSIHDSVGHFQQDLSGAQTADFDEWAVGTGGGGGEGPGNTTQTTSLTTPLPSTTDGPTTTPIAGNATKESLDKTPTTLSTSNTDSSAKRAAVALPLPSSCNLTAAFPLEAADGWSYVKLLGSLTIPRGITVDTEGNLLVVESGKGVTVHTFGSDGCISSSKTLISRNTLNHGITLTPDGKQLIVSSAPTAWRYSYDAVAQSVSNEEVVVQGMNPGSHSSRTTVIPPATPNLLVVSLGSRGNFDMESLDPNVGRALVKVFDLDNVPSGGYDYATSGHLLGYGLRNEVAIIVDGNNHVWGVENSGDSFTRIEDGQEVDIHNDNPAEELNYLGDPSEPNNNWYGYPTCFTVWDGSVFPNASPETGSQFHPTPNETYTDATCEDSSVAPRLSIQAHSAPIDGKFDKDFTNMYVSLHGSWNRDIPTGYKVIEIPFQGGTDNYEPVAAADSKTGYNDVLWDTQEGCNSQKCFRPSGIVWDNDFTRMFVASDSSRGGEIYILSKTG